ncbi:MAG: hypothetical protein R2705_15520, partial [Ilumatobacteraceae bacterium]
MNQSDGSTRYEYGTDRSVVVDAAGRVIETSDHGAVTSRAYDSAGRLVKLVTPDGRSFGATYTEAGRVATIDADGVMLRPTWHGDLLTALEVSNGSRYEYDYDRSGRLVSAALGAQRWTYAYGPGGELTVLDTPTGRTITEWADGLPVLETSPTGTRRGFDWVDGLPTSVVTISGNSGEPAAETLQLTYQNGQVASLATPGGAATFTKDESGSLQSYTAGDGQPVAISSVGGLVNELTTGDRGERWTWSNGQVVGVEALEGDNQPITYDIEWAAPGLLGEVTRQGETLARTVSSADGRPLAILDRDGSELASFGYDRGRLSSAIVEGNELVIERDEELRVIRATAPDLDLEFGYDGGTLRSARSGETTIAFTYTDGRLARTTLGDGGSSSNVDWDPAGRPIAFSSEVGSGSFEYLADGRVATISYDDRIRDVEYDETGHPSAEGTGGEFLADLFDAEGRFGRAIPQAGDSPSSPLVASLPVELGLTLPEVTTGADVVGAAIARVLPVVPMWLGVRSAEEYVERVVDVTLAAFAEEVVAFGPGATTTAILRPAGTLLEMDVEDGATAFIA